MSLKKLREKQKKNGVMKRTDMARNLVSHVKNEIQDFCLAEKVSIHEGLQFYAPMPENDKRPTDATRDICEYLGVRTAAVGNTPSSPTEEVFPPGEGLSNAKSIAGLAHLNKVFDNKLLGSIPVLEPGEDDHNPRVIDSALSRSELGRAFNRETILPLEVQRNVMIRLRIANVVAGRIPVSGDSGMAPILKTVEKVTNQGTANRRVPRYAVETDQEPLKLTEDGFEIEIDDAARRSSAATIGAIAESVRQRTEFFEHDIVNGIVQEILTGATPVAWAATPTAKDLMRLHLTLDDMYMLTTFAGTLEGVVEYLAIDPTYTSDTQRPATPNMRNHMIVDQMLGRETIVKRSAANVPALGADTDKKFGCWDRMNTFNFYTERGGALNDSYREEADRVQVIRFILNYGGRLRAEAGNCRLFVTMN